MYTVEDYLMKEKTSKSLFSFSSTVKRLFVLDFSVRAFYYKHSEDTFQCKPISTFREIVSIKDIENTNTKIKSQWPFAMVIETTKSTLTVYFDTQQKLQKWKDAFNSILEINSKIKKRRLSKARSQDKLSSSQSDHNIFRGD